MEDLKKSVIGRKYIGFENFDDFRKNWFASWMIFSNYVFIQVEKNHRKTGRKFISGNPSQKP
jgi:hypothetical protein